MIDLSKMTGDKVFIYLLTIIALIIPGFGMIYLTNFELLRELELLRLIILSIFFSMPLFVFGIIVGSVAVQEVVKKDDFFRVLLGASFVTIISFFLSAGFYISFPNSVQKIQLKWFVYIVSFLIAVVLGIKFVSEQKQK